MTGLESIEALFCRYDKMADTIMRAVRKHGPNAHIVSADHTFIVLPTAYGRDTSDAYVSVLLVIHIVR